jgi:hypothetical protein
MTMGSGEVGGILRGFELFLPPPPGSPLDLSSTPSSFSGYGRLLPPSPSSLLLPLDLNVFCGDSDLHATDDVKCFLHNYVMLQ